MKILTSVFVFPYRDDSKREAFRRLLKKEVVAKRDGSLLYKELEKYVSWLRRNYLDSDARTAKYEHWAADDINFRSIYCTTSQSESFNSKLKREINKSGTRNNAVKKLASLQKAAFNNVEYIRLRDLKTKRKKRRTIITTIIAANCHRQIKSLEMVNVNQRLSTSAMHKMKKLLILIADSQQKA